MKPTKKKSLIADQKISLVLHRDSTGSFVWQPPKEIARYMALRKEDLEYLSRGEIELAEFGADDLREEVKLVLSMQLLHISQIIVLASSHKGRPLDTTNHLREISEHIKNEMKRLNEEFISR